MIVNSEIQIDTKYKTENASILDASFVLLLRGWIPEKKGDNQFLPYDYARQIDIEDEFRFLAKYYKPIWRLFFLIYCIAKFHNPIKIIYSLLLSINVKRISLFNEKISDGRIFEDKYLHLKNNQKVIRIIIPTYNRYHSLNNLLSDLERQTYSNFIITIIDQSDSFNKRFYEDYNLNINLKYEEKPGLWAARNKGIKESNEEIIAFLDDDSRVDENWLFNHIKCLIKYHADISSGISLSTVGSKIPENYGYYRIADQLDTGNVLMCRHVFDKCGLFDIKFEKMRMGDGEFGLRAFKSGFLSISNPESKRIHLKEETGGLRAFGSWDALRPTYFFKPRPIPSVLYLIMLHFNKKIAIIYLFTNIPFSLSNYKYKGKKIGYFISIIVFIIFFPIIFFQVMISWYKAVELLNKPIK